MRCLLALVATLVAACYAPSAQPGAPCGPGGECPAGQLCIANVCGGTAPADDAPVQLDDAPIDTTMITTDAPLDGPPYVPWGTPVALTSLESPGSGETDPAVSSDKLTAVFVADTAVNDADIYIATRNAVTDTFTYTLLTALNTATFNDESPEISGDGNTIYFTSNRSGSDEVYKSTFTTVWSAPILAVDLSSASNDGDIAISPDGLTAVVQRAGSTNRFYIYTRGAVTDLFANGTIHTELNVTGDIAAPTITNNGAIMYLHAGGSRDLYVATRMGNGTYTTPVAVTELNMAAIRDAAPFVLQTDDYMIFERAGDIYETTR